FNRSEFLSQAIESLLNQSFADFELIVIDDCSTQMECLQVVRNYMHSDSRIRLVYQSENRGLAAGRNRGLAEAQAPLVAFLDDDDLYEPDKLALQFEFLSAHPHLGGCATKVKWIDAQGQVVRDQASAQTEIFPVNRGRVGMLRHVATHAMMARKQALQSVGGYRLWFSYCAEDLDMSRRLEESCELAVLGASAYRYRQLEDSMVMRPLCHLYGLASRISAWYRRSGLADPVRPEVDLWSVLAQIAAIPFEALPWGADYMADQVLRAAAWENQNGSAALGLDYLHRCNTILAAFPASERALPRFPDFLPEQL
ncbi:MAG: glycosyltransferase family 2 protein, partial [Gammaproteobacteria bacterium]